MGMRIQQTGAAGATQGTGAAAWQSRQQGMKDMLAALQSGDLGTAQKAYATMTADKAPSSSSLLGQIGQALQSGDVASAQKLGQEMQTLRSGHHHHHSGGDGSAPQSIQATPLTPATADGTGSIVNLVA